MLCFFLSANGEQICPVTKLEYQTWINKSMLIKQTAVDTGAIVVRSESKAGATHNQYSLSTFTRKSHIKLSRCTLMCV